MEFQRSLPSALVLMLVLGVSLVLIQGAEGSCTVQNNSGKKVIIVPVEVSVSIEVDVGASVEVPVSQQHCYFKNADSGHELGPVTLADGSLIVIVDGTVSGTVDVYVGVDTLGILTLTVNIFVSL